LAEKAQMTASFSRWFGVVIVAHVVGNWQQPDVPSPVGIVNLIAGLVGVILIALPKRSLLLLGSSLVIASFALEIPFTGNHWAVTALSGLGILLGGGHFERFAPALRVVFLIFYAFAAFAKLNSAFFDASVSCAVFYTNQTLEGFGLEAIGEDSLVARLAIWGTAAIELSVVPLLIWRRTRWFGIWLAAAFHLLVSLDLNQHFYDFTSLILALLFLFADDTSFDSNESPDRIARFGSGGLLGVGVFLVVLASLPSSPVAHEILRTAPFLLWIAAAVWWVWQMRASRSSRPVTFRPGLLTTLPVVLAVLNGLTPYTEVKTAFSFNMYSNLVTARGESNHFLVQHTIPLREGYRDLVTIVRASDPALDVYRRERYAIAYPQFALFLRNHPSAPLVRFDGGSPTRVAVADLRPIEWWWHFVPLRAIDQLQAARCQSVFLPAL
jgi:hypothetical protein